MAFTTITLTGQFYNPDGTPAHGTVTATLDTAITNSDHTIEPTPITGIINSTGQLVAVTGEPFTLTANNDSATLPTGTFSYFTVTTVGAAPQSFTAIIPYNAPSSTIDVSALVPLSPTSTTNLTTVLPAPSQAYRGQFYTVYGNGTTTGDIVYVCVLTTTNGYVWHSLMDPSEPIGYYN
jgi:hypothetical protein